MTRRSDKYKLTVERVRELLRYEPTTGHLIRVIGMPGGGKAGTRAGSLRPDGYRIVTIDGHAYLEHHVCWLLMTGAWPTDEIDHDDRNGANNVWTNLKATDRSGNMLNTGVSKNNHLGVKGVRKTKFGYQARGRKNGVMRTLGTFSTIQEAVDARIANGFAQ